jgi:transcriptional regulator with XRE-family HTH domain
VLRLTNDENVASEATKLLRAFALAVRRRREQFGLSQERFAFTAEIDRIYVSGVERGVRNPTVKMVARLAVALGTTASRLFLAAERGAEGKRA